MKNNASLGQLFLFAFTVFLVIPLGVVFVIFLTATYHTNMYRVDKDLRFVTSSVADKINSSLESPLSFITVLSKTITPEMSGKNQEMLLDSGMETLSILDALYVLDSESRVKHISLGYFNKYSEEDFIGIKLSDVKVYENYVPVWSRPFTSVVTNRYIVRVAVKFPYGYVIGDISLSLLSDTLAYSKGGSDNLFIADSSGDLITGRENFQNLSYINRFDHPVVREIYKGRHINMDYKRDGIRYAGAGYRIPIADWYVILEQKRSSAFGIFYDILSVTVFSAFMVMFFIFVILYMMKKRMLIPIRLLIKRSEQISKGTYSGFDESEKGVFRELRSLYESFEEMSQTLDMREKELKDKEEYVRSVFDSTTNTGMLVVSLDDDPVITDVNRGAQLILGYKTSELLGLPAAALVKKLGEDILQMQRHALEKNTMTSGRLEMVKKNGSSFPALCTVHPLFDSKGVITSVIVVFMDITEITKIQDALESEKERLDVTLKSIGEGVLATDRFGRITLVNKSTENLLGLKSKNLLGFSIKDILQIYDLETGEDISEKITEFAETSSKTFRANIISKESGVITVIITSSVLVNNHGKVLGSVYVFRDVTDRIKMEQELLRRKQLLEDINKSLELRVNDETEKRRKNEQMLFEQSKFAAMGQMISAIAHQWRQPLNALALYIQDIEDAYAANEINSEYLTQFTANTMSLVSHMSVTIDDFRNFFHSSNIREKVDVVSVVVQSLSLVTTQLKNQNIGFSITISGINAEDIFENRLPDKPEKYGDPVYMFPSEMKQVILNIFQNARDAINDRRRNFARNIGNIDVKIEYYAEKVTISISNDGGEIPEESINRIFDPYFTTKPEGEGTGIGLYMSKIMIEDHMGGLLVAENIAGDARFTVTLYYDRT